MFLEARDRGYPWRVMPDERETAPPFAASDTFLADTGQADGQYLPASRSCQQSASRRRATGNRFAPAAI